MTKICTKCGIEQDIKHFSKASNIKCGLKPRCKSCAKTQSAEYYSKNKDTILENNKKWKTDNNIYIKEKNYYQDPAKQKEYRELNKEYYTIYLRKWRKDNLEYCRIYENNRNARKRQLLNDFTPEQWISLKEKYDYSCLCCGKKQPEIKLTIDHIIPVSKDGPTTLENIQPLCKPCNSMKSSNIIDFRK